MRETPDHARLRIMVTGSSGYIGTLLVPMLERRGHAVLGVDTGLFAGCEYGPSAARRVLARDIRDLGEDDLRGCDAVVHLAALSNDPLSEIDPALTIEINHLAAVRLAALAKRAGVARFVFSSSCSVYGNAQDIWADERTPPAPLTVYAEAKEAAERGILALADAGFCVVMLRHGTAYGYSSKIRFDLVLNNFVAWAATTGQVLLKSDGASWRPLVHVEDIARAFVAATEAPEAAVAGEVFNVGRTRDNVQVRDLAATVAAIVPDCEIVTAAGAQPDLRSYRVDCRKAEARLPGFAPEWSIEAGVREVFAAICRWKLARGEFEGPRFGRVAHLRSRLEAASLDASLRPMRRLVAAALP